MSCTKETLDKVFSLYIRKRDCRGGVGRCISCGTAIMVNSCDCGHFIPRAHMATRFSEKNCAAQCQFCNRMQDGNMAGFTIGLVERYGDGVIEELKAQSRQMVRLRDGDYKELIRRYKQ